MAFDMNKLSKLKSKGEEGIKFIKSKASEIDLTEVKDFAIEKGQKVKERISDIDIEKAKEKLQNINADTIKDDAKKTGQQIKDKVDEKKDNSEVLNADKWLNDAIEAYNVEYSILSNYGVELYTERERAVDTITNVEKLINSIANHPKEFDKDFELIVSQKDSFENVCTIAKEELDAAKKSAAGAGSGMAAGVAVASLAPSAAIWVATTFGTASTGAAISSLSGAAAANAALAWLGGGALTAGGGGMAAGNALLALAGPIGWTIAGASILTSVVLFTRKKMKTTKEKVEEIEKVKTNTEALKESSALMKDLLDKTIMLREALTEQYGNCMKTFGKDFRAMEENEQTMLMTLVNNTKAIAATLDNNI
ncbi:MAG: hypothetical protein J1E81_09325 [Eubacterium sp.]|nr:hypothetical protein [Eubacterium sp.]